MSPPPPVAVVHLASESMGVAPLRRFLRSLDAHPAGIEHDLAVVLNGFPSELPRSFEEVLSGRALELVSTPGYLIDLEAYFYAAERTGAEYVLFCNASTEVLADRWLEKLLGHASRAGVGMVAATASCESPLGWAANPGLVQRLRSRRTKRRMRELFDPFPNPHLRTNAFMVRGSLFSSLERGALKSKLEAHALESGRRGISRQVADRGLELLVVGRDGVAYGRQRWPESATFRSGHQENLLVADNRTVQYAEADEPERRRLAHLAWGER